MSCWPSSSSRRLGADDRFAARQQFAPAWAAAEFADVDRRAGRAFVLPENQLPPADVVPAIELVANAAIDADRLETHRLMERDARRIRQRDSGKRVEVALPGKDGKQRRVQAAADVATTMGLGDVDGRIDRPL